LPRRLVPGVKEMPRLRGCEAVRGPGGGCLPCVFRQATANGSTYHSQRCNWCAINLRLAVSFRTVSGRVVWLSEMLDWKQDPHRRFNALTREWVLVSPHRTQRPWQGQLEAADAIVQPAYDPDCYLCP